MRSKTCWRCGPASRFLAAEAEEAETQSIRRQRRQGSRRAGGAPESRAGTLWAGTLGIIFASCRVREAGTHQELLAARGIYFKLFELQYKSLPSRSEKPDEPAAAARGV